ncbi:MAG: hypothetical protein AB3N63_01685 [Puniceicoccaceae bacterium]
MEYYEDIDHDKKIILIKTAGVVTADDLGGRTGKTRMKALKLDYPILLDYRGSNIQISLIEVYHWFADHHDKIDPALKSIPCAIVVKPEDEEFFNNVVQINRNRGGIIQSFLDKDRAIEWLSDLKEL